MTKKDIVRVKRVNERRKRRQKKEKQTEEREKERNAKTERTERQTDGEMQRERERENQNRRQRERDSTLVGTDLALSCARSVTAARVSAEEWLRSARSLGAPPSPASVLPPPAVTKTTTRVSNAFSSSSANDVPIHTACAR